MRSGGALAGGGLDGVGVKVDEGVDEGEGVVVGVEVRVEVGGYVAAGAGDTMPGVGEISAVGVGGETVGVVVSVGGRGVGVGEMGAAVGVAVIKPLSPSSPR